MDSILLYKLALQLWSSVYFEVNAVTVTKSGHGVGGGVPDAASVVTLSVSSKWSRASMTPCSPVCERAGRQAEARAQRQEIVIGC